MNKISDRTLALLYTAKKEWQSDLSADRIVLKALGQLYSEHMNYKDCIHHCLHAVLELMNEPRFQICSDNHKFIMDVLFYPVNGNIITKYGSSNISFEELYYSILVKLVTRIQNTNVGWCEEYKEYSKMRDNEKQKEQNRENRS